MASDVIDRQKLLKQLRTTFIGLKNAHRNTIFDSVEKVINKMPKEEINEAICSACMYSSPLRVWHPVEDVVPKNLEEVLVKTKKGKIKIAMFNNNGWLYEHDDYGTISYYFDGDPVTQWKAI